MDIFFCDECGSRVTDLDLRAGKGMRRRHDQICPQCVGLGLAAAWLARSGAAAKAANGSPAPAAVAVATAPDPIAIARDRALTQRDDPFGEDVLEPAPMAKVPPTPAKVHETDALPSKQPTSVPAPSARESSPFGDGFADAAGAMGALVGPLPSRQEGVEVGPGDDDLAERTDQDDDLDAMAATSPTAGIEVASEGVTAAKAETTAVPAKTEAKKGSSSRLSAAQKKNGGTSRRSTVTTPSRRVAPSPLASKKVMILSLISFAVVGGIFVGLLLTDKGGKGGPPQTIRQDLLVNFAAFVKDADTATKAAMNQPNDLELQRKAIAAMRTMNSEYLVFEKAATKSGWKEDGFEAQLDTMKFHDIKGRMQPINQRIFILEQQGANK